MRKIGNPSKKNRERELRKTGEMQSLGRISDDVEAGEG
jgi:hypothetical protein